MRFGCRCDSSGSFVGSLVSRLSRYRPSR